MTDRALFQFEAPTPKPARRFVLWSRYVMDGSKEHAEMFETALAALAAGERKGKSYYWRVYELQEGDK